MLAPVLVSLSVFINHSSLMDQNIKYIYVYIYMVRSKLINFYEDRFL